MDIAYNFAQYLQSIGLGTLNTDLFVGFISGQNGTYIERNGGDLHLYLPIEDTMLDVYVQNTSAAVAIEKIEKIKRTIHRKIDTEISNSKIYSLLVIGDVEDVARNTEQYKIFKISVAVNHRNVGLIS